MSKRNHTGTRAGRTEPAAVPPRVGPRPLALHLWLTMTGLMSSCAALPALRSASPLWRLAGLSVDPELDAALGAADPAALQDAVVRAARTRMDAFLRGLRAYHRHPYRRDATTAPALWSEGTTELLDYGTADGGPAVLLVPSLINRAYILDLAPDCSLARYLARSGLRPLLLDWGAPGPAERGFGLADYVARLETAIDRAAAMGGPVAVVGYCMGGLLALAGALGRPAAVSGLALLATPWDFHANQPERARATAAVVAPWLPLFDRTGMPVDVIQTLFAALDPFLASRKFVEFAALDPASAAARRFVALEDWLNDGVPLTGPVARETVLGWYGDNLPGAGAWSVGGRPVRAGDFGGPALVVVPDTDRIVPPDSALALGRALPNAQLRLARTGHIGMIVGGRAEREVWRPLADWARDP
jgi:polyhydroxyalkanoate synthase